jgi:hypothetical protein
MMIVLVAFKPQLFYLFWPAVLLWVISNRRWRVFLGFMTGILTALFISIFANPAAISQYITAFLTNPPADWATPTIGSYLRLIFGIDKFWLQFIPITLGLAWFGYVWLKQNKTWTWTQIMPSLAFASIITSPYAWTYDQVILVPAVLWAFVLFNRLASRNLVIWLWIGFLGITVLNLGLHRFYDELWFGWHALAILAWYCLVMRVTRNNEKTLNPSTA